MSYSFDDDLFFLSSLNEPMLSNDESQPIEEQPSIVQSDLICGVCGAPAHGFNFDQVTCESCKAFFRRNALKNTVNRTIFLFFPFSRRSFLFLL